MRKEWREGTQRNKKQKKKEKSMRNEKKAVEWYGTSVYRRESAYRLLTT